MDKSITCHSLWNEKLLHVQLVENVADCFPITAQLKVFYSLHILLNQYCIMLA